MPQVRDRHPHTTAAARTQSETKPSCGCAPSPTVAARADHTPAVTAALRAAPSPPGFSGRSAFKDQAAVSRLRATAITMAVSSAAEMSARICPAFYDSEDDALVPVDDLAVPRNATPDEIADFVLFAASDRARFATGSEPVADGGFTLGPIS